MSIYHKRNNSVTRYRRFQLLFRFTNPSYLLLVNLYINVTCWTNLIEKFQKYLTGCVYITDGTQL